MLPTAFTVIKNLSHELFDQAQYVTRDLSEVLEMDGRAFEIWVNEYYKATKPMPDKGVDGVTPDSIPIQTKTFEISRKWVDEFNSSFKYHSAVKQPVTKAIMVSSMDLMNQLKKGNLKSNTAIKLI